jgi:hypothetical protein
MQDMVPGLAIEEFSTPPSSPVMKTTRTRVKTELPTTNSVDHKPTRDSPNKSQCHDIQLGGYT